MPAGINCTFTARVRAHPSSSSKPRRGACRRPGDGFNPKIARTTRVCSYDRAGLGWSEAGDGLYVPSRVPEELRVLLDRANETGPVVLVGHETWRALRAACMRLASREHGCTRARLTIRSRAETPSRRRSPRRGRGWLESERCALSGRITGARDGTARRRRWCHARVSESPRPPHAGSDGNCHTSATSNMRLASSLCRRRSSSRPSRSVFRRQPAMLVTPAGCGAGHPRRSRRRLRTGTRGRSQRRNRQVVPWR